VPDGVAVMKELGARILYQYEELDRGARVRITTAEPKGVERCISSCGSRLKITGQAIR
jgi:hypothetical protein